MSVTSCTLILKDDENLTYSDNTHRPIDGTISDDDLHNSAIRWLERWVAADQEEGRAEALQLLGRLLYELVFRSEIKQNFEDTFASFDRADNGDPADTLRLELRFHPKAEKLCRLPWEFLYLKRPKEVKGRFLAGEHNHQLVLSRFVPKPEEPAEGRVQQALARPVVLMAISQPPDRQFSVDELRRSLQKLDDENKLHLIVLNNPTVEQLQEQIESREVPKLRPDIFYFVGHGDSDHLSIRLSPADARAHAQAVGASPLSPRPEGEPFGELKASGLQNLFLVHQPKLVFLQACKGDSVGREALYSLARAVVYANVPAVIAMQYEIESGPANRFAKAVFDSLIAGKTIGEAVTAGRIALAGTRKGQSWDRRDFGTPVVYVHDDIALVERPAGGTYTRPPDRTTAEAGRLSCPKCGGPVGGSLCGVCVIFLLCPACGFEVDQPGKQKVCGKCYEPFPLIGVSEFEGEEARTKLRAVGAQEPKP